MTKIDNPLFDGQTDIAAAIAAAGNGETQALITERLRELAAPPQKSGNLSGDLTGALQADGKALSFLAGAFTLSPFLRDCALIAPENLVEALSRPFGVGAQAITGETAALWRTAQSDADLMTGLRRAKRRMALCLGLADLGGWMEACDITRHLSQFADAALSATVDHLLRAQHQAGRIQLPDPDNPSAGSGLIVLGMGKYGAFEL
ncbi:MAG: hypothetical protein KDJ80_03505, partial [Nitratireductor sp.]|nr:hypothetical protein [Nitratireductor sp.]